MSLSPADTAKRAAAAQALTLVEDGMKLGLGTGSTAAWFVRLLAERVEAEGISITGVATSSATAHQAQELGLHLAGLEQAGWLDLTVDGADEFDPELNLIKGGGAALLQEKIVACASSRMVVISDASKRVATLGRFPLPVEVVRFGTQVTRRAVERLLEDVDVGARRASLRMAGDAPLVTDEGHHILDLHLERIGDPRALGLALNNLAGVVEHGIFSGIADQVILGSEDGSVEVIARGRIDELELMRNQDA